MADLTLRDAVVSALTAPHPRHLPPHQVQVNDADLVLAMPEMQAIRSALASMAAVIHEHLGMWHDLTATDALEGHLGGGDDPDSVSHIIAWVMDGEL